MKKLNQLFSKLKIKIRHSAKPATISPTDTASDKEQLYSSDKPIIEPSQDRFGRWPFARRIADTIGQRADKSCLVISIYGVWGDGKSSVLNLMKYALRDYPDIILIPFNPWHFGSEVGVLQGFFSTVASELGKALPDKAEQFGKALQAIGGILSVGSATLAGGLVSFNPGEPLMRLGDKIAETNLEESRDRVQKLLREANKRVVVLIDDIDRLDRLEIQALFKAVKLSAGFESVTYVLTFDEDIVASALGERYARGNEDAGKNFLEKIVQVPLHLPPADEIELRKMAFEGVNEALKIAQITLTEEQVQNFGFQFVRGIEPALRTPRQTRRYGNAIMFALPILKAEVNIIDQMLIEGIRVFYPKLYDTIRRNPEIFLGRISVPSRQDGERQRQQDLIENSISDVSSENRSAIRRLLESLFPRLGNTGYGSDWEVTWAREQRICSRDYFQRYFGYSILPNDISDLKLTQHLTEFENVQADVASEAWRNLVTNANAPRAIQKLRHRETTISEAGAEKLSVVIAKNADLLPDESGQSFASTFNQAAVLVYNLLERIQEGSKRLNLAREIIRQANPLAFAVECFRWFRPPQETGRRPNLFGDGVEREFGEILSNRIREEAQSSWLFDRSIRGAPSLLWIWREFGNREEVERYLHEKFTEDRNRVPAFLQSFTGQAWSMDTGMPVRSEFRRDAYDTVATSIDPELTLGHINTLFGNRINLTQYYFGTEVPIELAIANQFAYLHNSIRTGQNQGTGNEPNA